jgi:hypothetical protein
MTVSAHRLEANSRDARELANYRCSATEARDAMFSAWQPAAAADAILAPNNASEHRVWVNPGPFLAVLALERFVSLERRDEREDRCDRASLDCAGRQ